MASLDINSIVTQLMQAESAPLANFDKKTASLQARNAALGKVSAAVGTFQAALTSLNSSSTFQGLSATGSNKDVLSATAGAGAVPGKYNINVTQLAQAQSLKTGGMASNTAIIGKGAPTTITVQFGTASGGSFGATGNALGSAVATSGISNGSLSINGTAITTGSTTNSARALAEAINAQSTKTGVIATAGSTSTATDLFKNFGEVTTVSGSSYALSVGGVQIASLSGAATLSTADLNAALASAGTRNALAAANITVEGSATNGSLKFTAADGSSIAVTETVSGSVTGGIGRNDEAANPGSSITATAGIKLSSTSGTQITVGGTNPGAAGLSAGSVGSHIGSEFALNGAIASKTITLDAGAQSLQGIRDAINKGDMGVTATIVSDGSANPYHLVLTSNKTGEATTMKITVGGTNGDAGDPAIAAMLGYDPAGVQNLTQTVGAQSTVLNMNGIDIKSDSTTVTGAVEGVSLDVSALGSSTVTVSKNTAAISTAVNDFVKAYNDMQKTIGGLTGYNATTKTGGVLQGDASVRSIQSQLRRQIGSVMEGTGGKLNSLSQVGISFQQDGTLKLDSTKLNKAISENAGDIGSLFAAMGSTTDGLVKFDKSSATTKPGSYAVNVTELATRGTFVGGTALSGSTTIEPNTTWRVTLNQTDPVTESKTQEIKLTAGTYSNADLAAMLRSAINGNSTFAGAGDTVETSVEGGILSLSSSKYGSMSNVSIESVSGSSLANVFGATTAEKGKDVIGTIGGVAAKGNGQQLTASDSSGASGIQVSITGGAKGDRGTVTFSQGFAYQLTNLAASFIGKGSILTSKTDGLNASIKSIADQRSRFETRLEGIEKRYRAQFVALDASLASMQNTSNYLTQQLAALSANWG
ncbi:flagellar filament capping protein FliD [Massilia sp. YIM B02443]|uniref:flagellar filament capping protein FliD n=1 Tax=Massilia sp. YIM B02443 TaxID=3050127 RepID=UPI0025B6CD83|nr:flagellar filament capping protein FliD [Massilia sp. YIM B02443]